MHYQLSVVPLPAGAANIEGMDVTIVAPDARRAATFAATAATLPHWPCATLLVLVLVPYFWSRLCDTLVALSL